MPVTHDFNQMTASDSRLDLLVGFTNGAVQHLNPLKKEEQGVFNDDVSNNFVCVCVCACACVCKHVRARVCV